MNSRLATLSAAFRDVPLTCGPLTLRPLTAGTMMLLMDSGNALFNQPEAADGGEDPALTETVQLQAIFEFIWIHTAPAAEVVSATPGMIHARARAMALEVSFEDLAEFTRGFEQLQQRLGAAAVHIVPEKGAKPPGKPEQSPTGSPISSMPSAPLVTPPGSPTSSGSFLSSVLSNTSTPPTSPMDPAAAGPSACTEDLPPLGEDYALAIPLPS